MTEVAFLAFSLLTALTVNMNILHFFVRDYEIMFAIERGPL